MSNIRKSAADRKTAAVAASGTRLERENFTTSRLSEFSSIKELTTATGHGPDEWPLVALKELTDNGIDAAEATDVPPVINITVANNNVTISDNGGGIDADTIAKMLDFTNRVSSTEAYASPTRGRQGNALQTILAMAFALDGMRGETTIESRGIKHTVVFEIDPIRRVPKVFHTQARGFVQSGTRITVRWPVCEAAKGRFAQIATDYAALNPHLSITLKWDGRKEVNVKAADPEWIKWLPSDPTSAHWYNPERFDRLIVATIAHDQDSGRATLVREFAATFRGMARSSAQKAVLDEIGAARMSVAELFNEGKNRAAVAKLLTALQAETKSVRPIDLGVIGRENLEKSCANAGADLDTFGYSRTAGVTDGLPWVLEVAFGYCPDAATGRLIAGCNWSPGIRSPFRDLDAAFANQRVNWDHDPVIVVVHLACPVLAFTDRGKSTLALSGEVELAVEDAAVRATAAWAKQVKAEERDSAARSKRRDRLARARAVSAKDAVYDALPRAWLTASDGGTLPTHVRQVFYALRNEVQELTGKQLDAPYVTQVLIPDYISETGVDWDIVYDDRGHFDEPHTDCRIGLGTLPVRDYLAGRHGPQVVHAGLNDTHVVTSGADGNFAAVLFVEKEGFQPLLQNVKLAERFDIATMSSKGMTPTAARSLAEGLCGRRGIPLFVLHDFDKAGLSIASTLGRDTRRYQFSEKIKVIDVGLRLDDIKRLKLKASAEATFVRGNVDARRANLKLNGATEDEINFLLKERVELNAVSSGQLVQLIERKLIAHGVKKVVPNAALLGDAYRAFVRGERARPIVDKALAEASLDAAPIKVPAKLKELVDAVLKENPAIRWDEAVAQIARRP
jgi:DNA topoisomerase VI subunit B